MNFNRDDLSLHDPAVIGVRAAQVSPFVSIMRAAMILGVEVRTVRRWQKAGQMPARHKRSRRRDYDRFAIEAMAVARSGGR
jgi:hypothetical protein